MDRLISSSKGNSSARNSSARNSSAQNSSARNFSARNSSAQNFSARNSFTRRLLDCIYLGAPASSRLLNYFSLRAPASNFSTWSSVLWSFSERSNSLRRIVCSALIGTLALSGTLSCEGSANSLKKLLQPVTKAQEPEKIDIRDKWAMMVGVNRFTDPAIQPLKFAQKSSSDLARALKDPDSGHFGLDHVLVVNGVDATKEGIERSFNEWLFKKALPNDLVVIYFNSRLLKSSSGAAIIAANNSKASEPDTTGINLTDLIKSAKQRIGSQNIIVMLDLPPAGELSAKDGVTLKSIASANGVTILAGAEIFKPVYENQTAMRSRFVNYLVEALKSGGATFPLAMVAEYVWQKLKEESAQTPGQEQIPVLALASEQSQTSTIPLGIMVKSSLPPSSISVGHKLDDLAMTRPDIVPPSRATVSGPAGPTIGAKLQSRNATVPPAKAAAEKPKPAPAAAAPPEQSGSKPVDEDEDKDFNPNLDFGPYMAKMKKDIQLKWQTPKGFEARKVTTVFSIMRDGKIANVSIAEGSGNDDVDKSALAALEAASPLDPLPKGAPPSVDIRYVFDWKTHQGK